MLFLSFARRLVLTKTSFHQEVFSFSFSFSCSFSPTSLLRFLTLLGRHGVFRVRDAGSNLRPFFYLKNDDNPNPTNIKGHCYPAPDAHPISQLRFKFNHRLPRSRFPDHIRGDRLLLRDPPPTAHQHFGKHAGCLSLRCYHVKFILHLTSRLKPSELSLPKSLSWLVSWRFQPAKNLGQGGFKLGPAYSRVKTHGFLLNELPGSCQL